MDVPGTSRRRSAGLGRLRFRPERPSDGTGPRGLLRLEGPAGRPLGRVFAPADEDGRPMRLVLLLHGAGGVAGTAAELLRPYAEEHRLLLVAPKSTGTTWDVIAGGYGPDVRLVDDLLTRVSADYPVDGYAIAGFSDGASYALSLGLDNGDLFDRVVAFSPGFSAAQDPRGVPRLVFTHGTEDQVLSIDRCSRRIVPALRRPYDVTHVEFPVGHSVPQPMRRQAAAWLTG